jgi:hypothetical protein
VVKFRGILRDVRVVPNAQPPEWVVMIERSDVGTVHYNKLVEVFVGGETMDKIIELEAEGKTLTLEVKDGVIINIETNASDVSC